MFARRVRGNFNARNRLRAVYVHRALHQLQAEEQKTARMEGTAIAALGAPPVMNPSAFSRVLRRYSEEMQMAVATIGCDVTSLLRCNRMWRRFPLRSSGRFPWRRERQVNGCAHHLSFAAPHPLCAFRFGVFAPSRKQETWRNCPAKKSLASPPTQLKRRPRGPPLGEVTRER
jgi:hypothetical protein